MKNLILFSILVILLASCTPKEEKNWELVWSDEFDYNGLPDSNKWSYDTIGNAWGWGNNELQYYTFKDIDNAKGSDGSLKLTANKEKYADFNYTSARLVTKEKGDWLYGKIEVKAKLPDGIGLWPAIWMLPTDWEYGGWPRSGEIDIMENVGYNPDSIYATVHTGSFNHRLGNHKNGKVSLPDNRDSFHVYAIEWDSLSIKALVDNKTYFTFQKMSDNSDEWPFDKRFHLLLNIAVGGDWGGLHGVEENIFPATMEIDYVRVYQ